MALTVVTWTTSLPAVEVPAVRTAMTTATLLTNAQQAAILIMATNIIIALVPTVVTWITSLTAVGTPAAHPVIITATNIMSVLHPPTITTDSTNIVTATGFTAAT
jgi:hypothetical protein